MASTDVIFVTVTGAILVLLAVLQYYYRRKLIKRQWQQLHRQQQQQNRNLPASHGGGAPQQSEVGLPYPLDALPPSYEELILKPPPYKKTEVVVQISLDHAGGGQVPAESRERLSVFTIDSDSVSTMIPNVIRPLSGITPPPSYSVALDQLANSA